MNYPIIKFIYYVKKITLLSFYSLLVLPVMADQKNSDINSKNQKVNTTQAPLIIESQIKGSQEQPNVIYIMPWQGINNPIIIEGNSQKISLPNFKPINPKIFKQQAEHFYNLNVKNRKASANK